MDQNNWSVVYEKAIKEDGSLFFPERLNQSFLEQAKKVQGSQIFANQYLNEVFPEEDAKFRKTWFKYQSIIPTNHLNFAFVDPAISKKEGADYSGISVVSVDSETNWYMRVANRYRLNPTELVNKIFEIQNEFKCQIIGVESVAYQEALLYMLDIEARKRQIHLPLKEIKRGPNQSKVARILGLVPRYEFGRIYHCGVLEEYERELLQFPRGAHDDIIDSAASLESIIYYPEKIKENTNVTNPLDPRYESAYIRRLAQRANEGQNY